MHFFAICKTLVLARTNFNTVKLETDQELLKYRTSLKVFILIFTFLWILLQDINCHIENREAEGRHSAQTTPAVENHVQAKSVLWGLCSSKQAVVADEHMVAAPETCTSYPQKATQQYYS